MADGRKVKATTRDGLIDKLFNFYTDGLSDLSFKAVFKAALAEKEITENPKEKTIVRNEAEFKRFVSAELAGKDIRTIIQFSKKKAQNRRRWGEDVWRKGPVDLGFAPVYNVRWTLALNRP